MIQLRITAKNLAEASQRLSLVADRMADATPVLQQFGVQMLRSIEQTFQAGGRPRGWAPWATSTRRALERKRKGGNRILIDSGRLKNSIAARVEGTPPILRVGSNVIYSRIHQLGGAAGRGHKSLIPARPFLVVQDEDMEILKRMLVDSLTGGGNA